MNRPYTVSFFHWSLLSTEILYDLLECLSAVPGERAPKAWALSVLPEKPHWLPRTYIDGYDSQLALFQGIWCHLWPFGHCTHTVHKHTSGQNTEHLYNKSWKNI